ncbi:MAG: hypothetical protein LBE62_13480 [Azonexus sp.]|nr:hypothetical protein [Azonexus sp.]
MILFLFKRLPAISNHARPVAVASAALFVIRQYDFEQEDNIMAVSVRMDALLEKRLELAARQQGTTKSQFIISAVERALGDKDPYALMLQAKAEITQYPQGASLTEGYIAEHAEPYDTERSRADLIARLRAKHGLGAD